MSRWDRVERLDARLIEIESQLPDDGADHPLWPEYYRTVRALLDCLDDSSEDEKRRGADE